MSTITTVGPDGSRKIRSVLGIAVNDYFKLFKIYREGFAVNGPPQYVLQYKPKDDVPFVQRFTTDMETYVKSRLDTAAFVEVRGMVDKRSVRITPIVETMSIREEDVWANLVTDLL